MTTCFDLPEFDELTHRRLLPRSALRDGMSYIGRGRNASIGRWNGNNASTIGEISLEESVNHPLATVKLATAGTGDREATLPWRSGSPLL